MHIYGSYVAKYCNVILSNIFAIIIEIKLVWTDLLRIFLFIPIIVMYLFLVSKTNTISSILKFLCVHNSRYFLHNNHHEVYKRDDKATPSYLYFIFGFFVCKQRVTNLLSVKFLPGL